LMYRHRDFNPQWPPDECAKSHTAGMSCSIQGAAIVQDLRREETISLHGALLAEAHALGLQVLNGGSSAGRAGLDTCAKSHTAKCRWQHPDWMENCSTEVGSHSRDDQDEGRAMEVRDSPPVKFTFIHYAIPKRSASSRKRAESAPAMMLTGPFHGAVDVAEAELRMAMASHARCSTRRRTGAASGSFAWSFTEEEEGEGTDPVRCEQRWRGWNPLFRVARSSFYRRSAEQQASTAISKIAHTVRLALHEKVKTQFQSPFESCLMYRHRDFNPQWPRNCTAPLAPENHFLTWGFSCGCTHAGLDTCAKSHSRHCIACVALREKSHPRRI